MFLTDLLSIITSLNTVYTATGICHASYVDCLLARSGLDPASRQPTSMTNTYCSVYSIKTWWCTVDLSDTCGVLYQNLRNSASCWFLLQEHWKWVVVSFTNQIIMMHGDSLCCPPTNDTKSQLSDLHTNIKIIVNAMGLSSKIKALNILYQMQLQISLTVNQFLLWLDWYDRYMNTSERF